MNIIHQKATFKSTSQKHLQHRPHPNRIIKNTAQMALPFADFELYLCFSTYVMYDQIQSLNIPTTSTFLTFNRKASQHIIYIKMTPALLRRLKKYEW